MDIVTIAGTGRHAAGWRLLPSTPSSNDVVLACEPQGMPNVQRPRVSQHDQRDLPTFVPQRPSASSRWGP